MYKPDNITGKFFNPFVHFISNTSKTRERYDNLYHMETKNKKQKPRNTAIITDYLVKN